MKRFIGFDGDLRGHPCRPRSVHIFCFQTPNLQGEKYKKIKIKQLVVCLVDDKVAYLLGG